MNPLLGSGAIEGADIKVQSSDAELDAYFAKPVGETPSAGIVVIHENRGLVPYLRDVADGFARAIDGCADVMAEHFPNREGAPNRFPDRLIEI